MMVAEQEDSSVYPFPPFYSAGIFTWATPFFIAPTLLLATIVIFGGVRFLQTRNRYWAEISRNAPTPQRMSALGRLLLILSIVVAASFLGDTVVIVARAFIEGHWLSTMLAYYVGVSWLAWAISIACLLDNTHKFFKWHWSQYGFWSVAIVCETTVAWLWAVGVFHPRPGTIFSIYDKLLLIIFLARYVTEIFIFILSLVHMFTQPVDVSERQSLLSSTATAYGTIPSPSATGAATGSKSGTDQNASAFSGFFKKLGRVLPFIWPEKDRRLQFFVFVCFLLMVFGLVINIFTPLQIGNVVDQLGEGPGKFAWATVLAYVGLRFLQGGSGLIQAAQNWLWIPIGQYTTREISIKMFSHLHSLSLHFHINRKTGEVLRVMDRGTNSVVQLLSQIVFQVFPALANILIAVVVFTFRFSPPFGLIVFTTMGLYLLVTIRLTEWRTKFRRDMNELDNYARSKAVDSLLNFETVKYYGNEDFETNRYKDAIIEYQKADWKCSISLNVLNLAQNAVITAGLLAGSLLFAWEVSQGTLTSGDFVAFNMYMMQLYTPLHFFGTYYRMIQMNFIDMEKMLALFDEHQTVQDAPNATDLAVTDGRVVFDKVTFGYDERQMALKDISFSIPKGATVALVGPSGGGKSTILRLLFRFYDPTSGHIYIDGQDISQVKQASLRKNIGVVPQDTVLFNDTILYNIQYGDVNAPEDKVYNAARAAQIHNKILTFPDGYETKVGERGLRLSGGEKQRVAIARTILKDPPIILLDEATSALDTTTERHIQDALSVMTKNRTTLVIAHRLSTIVNADLILVIKDGTVVESGSHDELIKQAVANHHQGVYYDMWQKQLHDETEIIQEEGTATPEPSTSSSTQGSSKKVAGKTKQ